MQAATSDKALLKLVSLLQREKIAGSEGGVTRDELLDSLAKIEAEGFELYNGDLEHGLAVDLDLLASLQLLEGQIRAKSESPDRAQVSLTPGGRMVASMLSLPPLANSAVDRALTTVKNTGTIDQ